MEYQTTLNQFDSNLNYQPLNSYQQPMYQQPSYYQSTLNQFDSNLNYQSSSYQQPMYQQPSYYQSTLNQFDNSYNLSSDSGLYASNRLYGQFSTGGNLHDTFRVDRYDNIYGGHTSIDLGNNQNIHLDW